MKTEIIKIATFICMVMVLGVQALLQGSWRIGGTRTIKVKSHNRKGI